MVHYFGWPIGTILKARGATAHIDTSEITPLAKSLSSFYTKL